MIFKNKFVEKIEFITKDRIAPFWKRVLAFIFDVIIIDIVILYPFDSLFGKFDINNFVGVYSTKITIALMFILILTYIYWVAFEWKVGQTPGKLLFNLYVAGRERVKFEQILIRNLSKPFILILFVDVAYMFFKKENQRFFEKMSNTFVIERVIIVKVGKPSEDKNGK